MQDFEKLGSFYLGKIKDGNDHLLLYDSKDLVTHAVCVGMTGSGKTGLCIGLLEEAAIDGVPAIAIDPKGDLSNLLLQFPELRGQDFEPWVNADDARRQNVSVADFAESQAKIWRDGLAKWDETGERIRKLSQSADFSIYTPGSEAGLPLSIVKSFSAPKGAMAEDRELVRDRIGTTATAVLSLLGIDAEPMKSREHILLSNIFDRSWREGKDLDLPGLIQSIQKPGVDRIGVVELESFYPAKDRFELAMQLNNLLASPGFESWLSGEPMDIDRLLYTDSGKPRISVISIAHLSETERTFFVSLLLNEMLSWTRMQSGTTSLRAILYMDEIFGYFPPVSNPPTKRPLLTLLKQARAFGVGLVLATQNPVDLDYKGLSNCGTWFIGRLQTERDKNRLLEGLESAASEGGGHIDRGAMDAILSSLGKRVFLMNNVHDDHPVQFETRWTMSYLRGPLTRSHIKALMDAKKNAAPAAPTLAPASSSPIAPSVAKAALNEPETVSNRVMLPPEIAQKFLPLRGEAAGVFYQPALLGVAQVRFVDAKSKVDFLADKVLLTPINDDAIPVEWEECQEISVEPNDLESEPQPNIPFHNLPASAAKAKSYTAWTKDLISWIYSHEQVTVLQSPSQCAFSFVNETEAAFRARLAQSAREKRDADVEVLRKKYAPKIATLQERLRRAEQARQREEEQKTQQTYQSVISVGSSIVGALFGRKTFSQANIQRATSAVRAAGRIQKESQDVGRATETVEAVQQQLNELNAAFQADVAGLEARTDPSTEILNAIAVKPKKTNIAVRLFTLAWAPYRKDASGQLAPAWE
jgi:DNA helicase HerA-like ATPase